VRDLLLKLRGRAHLSSVVRPKFGNSCCQIAIEKAVQAQEETLVSLSVVHAGKEAAALRAPGKNRACILCGRSDGAPMNVDHIRPLSYRWNLVKATT
jgi:hypothetical protein